MTPTILTTDVLKQLAEGLRIAHIRDLHTAGDPVSETGGTVNRVKASIKADGFGQAISSLKFVRRLSAGLSQLDVNPPGRIRRDEGIPVNTSGTVGR